MKKVQILVPVIILLLFSSCMISSKPHVPFISKADLSEQATIVNIRMPMALAKPFIKKALKDDGSYNRELAAIINKVKKITVLTIEGNTRGYQWQEDFFRNNRYEELASIISDGSKIRLMARTNGESIRNLYILVKDGDNMVYVNVSGKLKYSDIESLINIAGKENSIKKENASL
ncbi:MAG: DUF4252 domain-containing protein [Niabella sp.]